MAAAIWSSKPGDMLDYPAKSFIRFFQNHGLLQVDGRPKWGTVNGGARQYVRQLMEDGQVTAKLDHAIIRVDRRPDCVILHDERKEMLTGTELAVQLRWMS